MGIYADQVSQSELFEQFDRLGGRKGADKVTAGEIIALKSLVTAVADAVGPHLDRIRETFQQYTEHDMLHLCNVADLVCRFLPKKKRGKKFAIHLNALELAMLWLAILLHDIGMYVSDGSKWLDLSSIASELGM